MKTTFFLTAMLISFSIMAQDTTYTTFPVSSIQIYSGSRSFGLQGGSLGDFRQLAPSSKLIRQDVSVYTSESFNNEPGMQVSGISIQLQPHRIHNRNLYRNFRLGVGYYSNAELSGFLDKETEGGSDTLVSGGTGQLVIADTTYHSSIYMNYTTDYFTIDGAYILQSDIMKRWTFYTGAGVSFGIGMNPVTYITTEDYTTVEMNNYLDNYSWTEYDYSKNESKTESFTNKAGFIWSAYVPFGIDFRIGKKREFWKHVHLYMELNMGISGITIPELRSTYSGYSQSAFGLKATF